MPPEIIASLISAILPTMLLIFGGQFLINRFEVARKGKEQEIELIRSVREKQYEAVEQLYALFGRYMVLYRISEDLKSADVTNDKNREILLEKVIQAESDLDALILRIGCEFTDSSGLKDSQLGYLLGSLRQSVKFWKEQFRHRQAVIFTCSWQLEYVQFKETFADTAAYLVDHIHHKIEPRHMEPQQARKIIIDAFDNSHEGQGYTSIFKSEPIT